MNECYNNKLAYCIPTYNRPEQISLVLKNSISHLNEYGIDLYIYDSSTNDNTEIISKEYESYTNFHYIRLPYDTKPLEKIRMIYTGVHQIKKYQYIWLIKDRVYCSKDILGRVIETIKQEPDAIFLRAIENSHTVNLTTEYYNDSVSFYHDWGWLTTSWDVLILSRKKILDKLVWNNIIQTYKCEKTDNISFIPVVALFTTLSDMTKYSIPVLNAEAGVHIINLPMHENTRDASIFVVWGYEWYYTNMKLPSIYNREKQFVVKSATSLPWLIGDQIRLIKLWKDGFLTDEKLSCVKDIWSYISDIPWSDVCRIKEGDKIFMEQCVSNLIWDSIERNDISYIEYSYNNIWWMKDRIITKDFKYTLHMMEIYLYEKGKGSIHIFDGGNSKEFIFMKIDATINFLSALESFDDKFYDQLGKQMRYLINNRIISSSMIVYLVSYYCKDAGIVFERFIDFMICDM